MKLEIEDGIARIALNAGKANAMNPEFVAGVAALWNDFEGSDARAAVLTGYDRFFCAGLDLVTLTALDRDAMRAFMGEFDALMRRIFGSPRPVVAAVNGHAIAGGCVLALQADVRVFPTEGAKIGLNETQLGVGLPSVVVESLRVVLPPAAWLPVALEGRIVDGPTALELGLVDELVAAPSVVESALAKASELAEIPAPAYAQVKRSLRGEALERMEERYAEDAEQWLDTWFSAEARERVAAAVASLGARA